MKKILLLLGLAATAFAQQNTNVQKRTDGTNTLTAPITVPAGSVWNGNTISNTGEGGAGNVAGILQADGAGNVSAFTLLPTNAQTCYVSKAGNDSTADGSYFKPFLTISAAITSITDASSSKYYQVVVGPGTYTENLTLKPAIFVVGENGGGGGEAGPVRINGTIVCGSTFSTVGARWGLANLICLSSVTIDLHAIGGAVVDTGDLFNFVCFGNFIFTARGSSEGFFWSNGYVIGTSSFNSGQVTCTNIQFVGNWTVSDSLATPFLGQFFNCPFVGGTETVTGSAVGQCIVRLYNCSPTQNSLTITGADSFVQADVTSIPYASGLSISGGATLSRYSDAIGVNYAPGTSSNWSSVPSLVSAGLDTLASSGVVKTQAANTV